MMECALQQFRKEPRVQGETPVVLWEITMRNLLAGGEIDHDDFLARAELLSAIGGTVMISDYAEYFRLAAYLCRHTPKPIGMVMGIPSLRDLFDPRYYEWLEGGILEGFGRLFKHDLKLFVYPELVRDTGELITVQKLEVDPTLEHLYEHLVGNRNIESIDLYSRDYLKIWSREVLCLIATGDPAWEKMVPEAVAARIREKGFFGCPA